MNVWKGFKFDVAYAKEYFERRDKGEDPKKVWPEMKQRFDKKIQEEVDAQKKQQDEEQAKVNETLEIKKKIAAKEAKEAAEKAKLTAKEKVQQMSANDLEAILSGKAPPAAAPAEKKDEAKPETKQETKPAEVQCPKCNKLVKPDMTDPAKPCCPECKTPLEIKQTPPPADTTQQKQGEGEQKPAADQPAKETPKEGEKAAQ
jgi:phage FluMu protein Com